MIKLIGLTFGVALLAVGCSSAGSGSTSTGAETGIRPATTPTGVPGVASPAADVDSGYQLLLAASDVAVEPTRLPFVVIGPDGAFVEGATVSVAFLRMLDAESAEFIQELPAVYRTLQTEEPHQHDDGSVHVHLETRGVYVVDLVTFDTPGQWALQASVANVAGRSDTVHIGAMINVLATSFTPAIGVQAPRSAQRTARDVVRLEGISTRQPPIPALYDRTVAEAIDTGRPVVVSFSTPEFCQSRLCGPVLEDVIQIMPEYQGRVEFIHIEPFDLDAIRSTQQFVLVPAAVEWGLPSEPWTFIIDSSGVVAAKFEGIVTAGELRTSLDALLGD